MPCRLDFQELKLIFKRYTDVFSDEDVHAIGELFYKGKNGESVSPCQRLLRGVVHATKLKKEKSPLSLSDPTDSLRSYDGFANTIQSEFEEYLLQYIGKKCSNRTSDASQGKQRELSSSSRFTQFKLLLLGMMRVYSAVL